MQKYIIFKKVFNIVYIIIWMLLATIHKLCCSVRDVRKTVCIRGVERGKFKTYIS